MGDESQFLSQSLNYIRLVQSQYRCVILTSRTTFFLTRAAPTLVVALSRILPESRALIEEATSKMRSGLAARNTMSPSLPNGILLAVTQFLEKSDLKSLRLVTMQSSFCAAVPLFDRVYISQAQEDLEIFKAISNRSIHSKSVREIIYDCSELSSEYSLRD